MKLICQTIGCLSLLIFNITFLEAKSLEVCFDRTTQESVTLDGTIMGVESTSPSSCRQIKIENVGDKPIKKCFPYTNHKPCLSLEALAERLAPAPYPLLALYDLWNRSLIQDATLPAYDCHPLDLLNFKGACCPATYILQFVKLCNALGIKTRLANIHGKNQYDFCLEDEWYFIDISQAQLYLNLDNERLASSEEVMDDPFLALRTKHLRKQSHIDFKEGWKALAQFEILEAASAMPVIIETPDLSPRGKGFDLYPKETILFSELPNKQRAVEHTINLEARHIALQWKFRSPVPIRKIENNSSAIIRLIGHNVYIKPGESLSFDQRDIFQIALAFSTMPKGKLKMIGSCAANLAPSLTAGENHVYLGTEKNPSKIRFTYALDESREQTPLHPPAILNGEKTFDYCSPTFKLQKTSEQLDQIWWQISVDPDFLLVPSTLEQIEAYTSTVALPMIAETFLNPDQTYYFRVKGSLNGQWTAWSAPIAFSVKKPSAVEAVEFDQIDDNTYELNWERYAEEGAQPVEYLIYGSNSLDFIPSIYCETQVNAIVDGIVVEEEANQNLVATTNEPRLKIDGGLAYYRIIARQKGQLSVPSRLIHVYDTDLVQPRNVLQMDKDDQSRMVAKRTLFPAGYPWSETSLPHHTLPVRENILTKLQLVLRSAEALDSNKHNYERPDVEESIWAEVRPYLLPPNHPAWAKLNRVFCKSRVTQSPDHFKSAGFKRWRPGRWSRVSASSHPEFVEYFIKAYCDVEMGILYDWRKWIHRIQGAETIRKCIKDYDLEKSFKVPHKWIYPLPKNPAPPNSSRLLRKNFILVCENMRIEEHESNEKKYKKMDKERMRGLYIVLQVCGLYDSVYCFNIPFCKDGRIAVIDTEYHHKWPVPFQKLKKSFSKKGQSYWEQLTFKGGKIPDGVTKPNPPRMDRRDVPEPRNQKNM